ncbi:hypothetical protein [Streptomyces sp. NPDC001153]
MPEAAFDGGPVDVEGGFGGGLRDGGEVVPVEPVENPETGSGGGEVIGGHGPDWGEVRCEGAAGGAPTVLLELRVTG